MVVVPDLLDMFIRDPQIEANEARHLITEIVDSVAKLRALEGVLVVVSLLYEDGSAYNHHNNKPSMSYNRTILPRFDKCIEIVNSKDNRNKMIDIKMWDNSRKIKNTSNDFLQWQIAFYQ
jgi:hypothetical protein